MRSVTFQLDEELHKNLDIFAQEEQRTKSQLIRFAVERYMQELKADKEDADIALARMKDPNRVCYTTDEMIERLKARKNNV